MAHSSNIHPKVSIFMPTYNHEAYIEDAINSVIKQETNFPFELHIVEDFSTDNTRAIVQDFQQRYPEIIHLHLNKKNMGGRYGVHKFFKYLQGTYFAFLEGDDYWISPTKLQQQVDILDSRPEFMASTHNVRLEYVDGSQPSTNMIDGTKQPEIVTIKELSKGWYYFHTSSMLYRNIFKGKLPKPIKHKISGDWLWCLLHADKGPIYYINEVMSVYRIHNKGAHNSMLPLEQDMRNIDASFIYNDLLERRHEEEFFALVHWGCHLLEEKYAIETFPWYIKSKLEWLKLACDPENVPPTRRKFYRLLYQLARYKTLGF